jgi:hypothetical protein
MTQLPRHTLGWAFALLALIGASSVLMLVGRGSQQSADQSDTNSERQVAPTAVLTRGPNLCSVTIAPDGNVAFALGEEGLVLQWKNGVWSRDEQAIKLTAGQQLSDVAVNEHGSMALAVGERGMVMRWDGTSWKRLPEAETLARDRGLWGVAIDSVGTTAWVVGQWGIALRWKDQEWRKFNTPMSSEYPMSPAAAPVDMIGLDAVWVHPNGRRALAVGAAGTVIQWNGSAWKEDRAAMSQRQSVNPFSGLRDIAIPGEGNGGWIVGNSILKRTRSGWKREGGDTNVGDPNPLFSVASDSTGRTVYAVGWEGRVLAWNGVRWAADQNAETEAAGKTLVSVCFDSKAKTGFAVGLDGVILKWDGSAWTREPMVTAKASGADRGSAKE